PDRGAIVTAFVVLAPGVAGGEHTRRALQEFAKSSMAPYKYPRLLEFVPALPRNANGKLQRYLLRRRAAALPAGTQQVSGAPR
ncbi:MAG: 2-aminobenzoate-CoA ligase, partial [Pseudonocardiales bacterium]|nr:2-aminobenzoate-CoA ligase [Pseudonocardiales bacterium]